MSVVGIITARSGSKSLKNKNELKLGTLPLLGWIVNSASKSKKIDYLIFSSDSERYYNKAKKINKKIIFHKRNKFLSKDVTSEKVLLDVTKKFPSLFEKNSIIVLLQPTTPFILTKDIDSCITKLEKNSKHNSCITVKSVSEFPEWMITKNKKKFSILLEKKFSIRQNIEERWIPNGGAYAVRLQFLQKNKSIFDNSNTLIHEMPKIRSMDIDESDDFELCKAIVKAKIHKL